MVAIPVLEELTQPWRDFALCKGSDPRKFFPDEGAKNNLDDAVLTCAQCPVAQPCREYGKRRQEYGFWGGHYKSPSSGTKDHTRRLSETTSA